MKLYNYWRSLGSLARAHRARAQEASPYEYVAGATSSRRRPARRRVPRDEPDGAGADARVAEDGHGTLSQSLAILEYLEERLPDAGAPAADPYLRARARQLAEIVNSGIQPLQNLPTMRASQGARRRRQGGVAAHFIARGLAALERAARDDRGHVLRRRRAVARRLLPGAAALRGAPLRRRPRAARRSLLAHRGSAAWRCPRSKLRTPTVSPTRQPDASEVNHGQARIARHQARSKSLHYYVHDLERSRRFFIEQARLRRDWRERRPSSSTKGRQRSAVLPGGRRRVRRAASRVGEGGRAWRYLRKHPDGVGTLVFEVEDIEQDVPRCSTSAAARSITDIQRFTRRRRHAGHVLDHHAVRRHAPSASSSARLPARCSPGCRARRSRAAARTASASSAIDHVTVELPDHEAGAALDGARARASSSSGRSQFHTSDVRRADARDTARA